MYINSSNVTFCESLDNHSHVIEWRILCTYSKVDCTKKVVCHTLMKAMITYYIDAV